MNAENFYEEFKEALKYLGVGWGNKNLIEVKIKKDKLVMKYGGKEVHIKIKEVQ